jgi:hypothetical protein
MLLEIFDVLENFYSDRKIYFWMKIEFLPYFIPFHQMWIKLSSRDMGVISVIKNGVKYEYKL